MTRYDAGVLARFISTMGMYIGHCDEHGIVSFIDGYECGRRGHCKFTRMLSAELADRKRIRADCLGWPGQVKRFGKRGGLGWVPVFNLISSTILTRMLEAKTRPGVAGTERTRTQKHHAEPDGPANGSQPVHQGKNSTTSAGVIRRRPLRVP
jgi:hypothetical protein